MAQFKFESTYLSVMLEENFTIKDKYSTVNEKKYAKALSGKTGLVKS